MVQTIDRPAEFKPEIIDRPYGRSFFKDSFLFYLDNKELFPSTEALVIQFNEEQLTHTVLLDASNTQSVIRWQLTTADPNGRKTTELQVNPCGEVSGWSAIYNNQGVATRIDEIDESNWHDARYTISAVINSQRMEDIVTTSRASLAHQEQVLGEFILTGTLGNIKLYNGAHQKELKHLKDRLKKSGFSTFKLNSKPKI